jgi:DNA-binding IclR family transcriptional regulator
MIAVLAKAADILALVARSGERGATLTEIAAGLRMRIPTCANILRTLASRGFIEQIAPRQGYRLGVLPHQLAAAAPYRADLVRAAQGPVGRLANDLREAVLVAALGGGRRVTLCQAAGQRDLQVRTDLLSGGVYDSATGRMLLAHLDADSLDDFVAVNGLGGEAWPEAATPADLRRELEDIRRAGLAQRRTTEVIALACPIRRGGVVVAALGVYMPLFRYRGEHRRNVLAGLRRTADSITQSLDGAGPSVAAPNTRRTRAGRK